MSLRINEEQLFKKYKKTWKKVEKLMIMYIINDNNNVHLNK